MASCGPAATGPCLFCAEGLRSEHRTSRWVHTRAEQRGRITSLDLLVTLLLMQPRTWLASWAGSAHCYVLLSFSSNSTPKSCSSGLLSVHSPPTPYLRLGLPQTVCSTLHLVHLACSKLLRVDKRLCYLLGACDIKVKKKGSSY